MAKGKGWRLTIQLSDDVKRALKMHMAAHDIEEFQEIGEEMLAMWAKANGVKLPKSNGPRGSQQSNGTEVLVNSVG